jgi:hypothetical protein
LRRGFLLQGYEKTKTILPIRITNANDNGKYDFHNSCIKASYRILGKLALTQIKQKQKNVVLRAKFI